MMTAGSDRAAALKSCPNLIRLDIVSLPASCGRRLARSRHATTIRYRRTAAIGPKGRVMTGIGADRGGPLAGRNQYP
jgi:hypothetical protein